MRRLLLPLLLIAGICVGLLWAGSFGLGPVVVVREDQILIVLRFGEVVKVLDKPGPSWRLPLIDQVITYDARLQYLNAEPVEKLAQGGEKLIIDFYAVWRLSDAHAFRRPYPRAISVGRFTRMTDRTNRTTIHRQSRSPTPGPRTWRGSRRSRPRSRAPPGD